METNIEIITDIQTKPRPRATSFGGFTRIYTPKTALDYEHYIASEYQRQGGHYFGESCLYVELTFYFRVPASFPKYKKRFCESLACMNPKDLDNLAKSVLDALNTIAYKDDRQIDNLWIRKQWTEGQESIRIKISELPHLTDQEAKEEYKKWQAKK